MADKPKAYEQEAYVSKYGDQIASRLEGVTNKEAFSYDPLQDVSYQALAKMYNKQGEQAAKNTMGDAAILNGGYGSSYAVTAANQARNDYNQMLTSQIPALQEAAYNRYIQDYNMDLSALQTLQSADADDYGKYRDSVGDGQWSWANDYQAYRDAVADKQWQENLEYQKERDEVADKQWAKEYALAKKKSSSSGGGGGGGSRYVSSGGSGSGGNYVPPWYGGDDDDKNIWQKAAGKVKSNALSGRK